MGCLHTKNTREQVATSGGQELSSYPLSTKNVPQRFEKDDQSAAGQLPTQKISRRATAAK